MGGSLTSTTFGISLLSDGVLTAVARGSGSGDVVHDVIGDVITTVVGASTSMEHDATAASLLVVVVVVVETGVREGTS